MIDTRYQDFWWGAYLWRTKGDKAAYQALLTMRAEKHLNPKIVNRIAEIEHKHEEHRDGSLRSPTVA